MAAKKKKDSAPPPPPPVEAEEFGYACPECGCRHLESRGPDGQIGRIWLAPNGMKRRRKYCRNCGRGVITVEIVKTFSTKIGNRS